jgi:hypothetical protein
VERISLAMGRLQGALMFKLAAVLCLSLTACATSGTSVARESTTHAARSRQVAASDPDTAFPRARDPQLPRADRISREIRTELGDVASAEVRLCIAPGGQVQRVELVRGSRLRSFDDAVVKDMAHWHFDSNPDTGIDDNLRSCGLATVSYRPHP